MQGLKQRGAAGRVLPRNIVSQLPPTLDQTPDIPFCATLLQGATLRNGRKSSSPVGRLPQRFERIEPALC